MIITDRVIVTIKECCCDRCFDLELPTNQKIEWLIMDIVQALAGYMPELMYKIDKICLVKTRTASELNPMKTLCEEGVRNGDVLVMEEH